jgi:hypothetical protein
MNSPTFCALWADDNRGKSELLQCARRIGEMQSVFLMKEAPDRGVLTLALATFLRNGSDKLRWRERLRQHDAVRDALGRPIVSVFAAHVNDGKVKVDFPGVSRHVPAVEPVLPEIDVGDEGSKFSFGGVKQLYGIFAGRSYDDLESPIGQALLDHALNEMVVLNDQDNR